MLKKALLAFPIFAGLLSSAAPVKNKLVFFLNPYVPREAARISKNNIDRANLELQLSRSS
jgi:hypothetical protein